MMLSRYLHNYDSLRKAFENALIEKKDDACMYFAYELYFSGWESDVWEIIWKVYYLFKALGYPEYEIYLKNKEKEWKSTNNSTLIREVLQDLLIRQNFPLGENESYKILTKKSKPDLELVYKDVKTNVFKRARMIKYNPRNMTFLDKEILILRIIQLQSKLINRKIEFYTEVEQEEVEKYQTKQEEDAKSWKILRNTISYNTDDFIYEKVSNLNPSEFLDNWLFYAKDCPLWKKRLSKYNHQVKLNKIEFENEDQEEDFWNKYNLEPDEQPKDIQIKLNCFS